MKILHLCISAFFIDNYSYQENLLAKYHVKQGHEVTVIASPFTYTAQGIGMYLKEASSYFDPNGFKVVRLLYKKPFKLNRLFRHYDGLYKSIKCVEPDLIFLHGVSFGDTVVIRDYIKNHPHVILYADNHADYINSAKNWLSKNILHRIFWRRSAKLLEPYLKKCWGVTPLRCKFLKEMYHIKQELIEFLPMGVDDDSIPNDREWVKCNVRKELNVKDDDMLIFTGGKIDSLKNIHVLLEALTDMRDQKIHLVICGTLTPQMQWLKAIIDSDIRVHYLGWCSAERVMDCMIASDISFFPGTHSTLWEQSVGIGIPIICKQWEGMDHVNINGNCLFVKGEDVEELKYVINSIKDTAKLDKLKSLAIEASSEFLYSNISKKAIGCF